MKSPLAPLIAVACLLLISLLFPFPVRAQQAVAPDAAMQSCTSNADCVLTNTACATGCQFAPINRQFIATLQNLSHQSCGASNETVCTAHPPLQAACINARCTIDYSFSGNADARDYAPGTTRPAQSANNALSVVPAAPRAHDVPFTALDRSGHFTADNLPPATVERGTLGSLTVRPAR